LLVHQGIGPGDRVILWGENSAEWIAAFHGCMLRGVLAVPLDASGSADFAARIAADTHPKLIVGDTILLDQLKIDQLDHSWPRLDFEDWPAALPTEEAGPVAGLSAATPLQILFTSGTTGEPKGVVLTHGNVLASIGPIRTGAEPYMRWEKLIHPLRILHTLPLSHVFGQTMGLWVPPIFAAELHLENRPVASRLIETIRRERISVLAAVPRVHALLKTHLEAVYPGLAERAIASQAKKIGALRRWIRFRKIHSAFGLKFWALISGGGALPGPLEQFWNTLGFVLVQGYGMTETTALITLNHPFHVARGTIGKPMPGREVKLGPDGEVLVRGASIANTTWSHGALHARHDEWLSTGDIAQAEPSGELRFLGRKSEVIVTAAGLNVHPEDLEAALEQQPGVIGCAVVPLETAEGPEPFAVLAFHGRGDQAASAIEHANKHLAAYQRIRRWALWPGPDLPRTSTGKVRRTIVAGWLTRLRSASAAAVNGAAHPVRDGDFGASSDWLLTLIAQLTGESQRGVGDELRLTEDLHLDSLGRVQLAAAVEERLGISLENGPIDSVETLGQLRRLIAAEPQESPDTQIDSRFEPIPQAAPFASTTTPSAEPQSNAPHRYRYPRWPWLRPFQWLRAAFVEALMRPLVWLLAAPRVVASDLTSTAPMLIVANHVSTYDGPLLEYALPGPIRRRIAVAMSGEMLAEYRRFRNPEPLHPTGRFFLPGPLFYFLLTALFNVFPLPRREFQPSFAHAGLALDRGFNVLVFPEGTRSPAGELGRFRPGIGLLVRQSGAPVLPIAIRGLGELKTSGRWFRSGRLEVRIGHPIHFSPSDNEASITARLHAEVEKLLKN
jgi:long-chain acyl-CoA synthetase